MRRQFIQPSVFLLIIGTIVGVALCIFIPFGTGFDEDAHLARVYDISGLNLIPNRNNNGQTISFLEFYTLSQRRFFFRDQGFTLFKPEMFLVRANYDNMATGTTLSMYPPIMFFPQAIIAGIGWRWLDLPIIPVTIVIRIVGLAVYLFGCFLSIKVLPWGRWAILAIALTPTALYQAATVNGDGYNYAISFLFTCLILSFIVENTEPLSKKQLIALCIVIILVGMGKPGAVVLLLLILLLPRRLFSTRSHILILYTVAIVVVVFHIYWMSISLPDASGGLQSALFTFETTILNLFEYVRIFWHSMNISYKQLFGSMVADYGYWIGNVPKSIFLLVPIMWLVSILCEEKTRKYLPGQRIFIFVMFIISCCIILFLYTMGKFTSGAEEAFSVVQGRYLVTYLPLLLIPFIGLIRLKTKEIMRFQKFTGIGISIYLILFFWGLFAHYYTACGPYLLSRTNCQLPAYQNLETRNPSQLLIAEDVSIQQEISIECRNIQSVEVLMGNISYGARGSILFSITSDQGDVVARNNADVDSLVSGQKIVIDISDRDISVPGKNKINLETRDLMGKIGFGIREPDVYPEMLTVSNRPVDGDLIFYYYCTPTGLFGY